MRSLCSYPLETVRPRMALSLAMDATDAPDITLTELAALGLRAARVVTRMMEIEQAAAETRQAGCPPRKPRPRR
jgi:hypothetical protein